MKTINDLLQLMRVLRDPDDGCPWDSKQTIDSIRSHSLDEIYELLDAIDRKDMPAVRDELGDLLFHVVFYAQIASETGDFDFNDVVTGVVEKLQRRHPHVFADMKIESRQQLSQTWESIKREERIRKSGDDSLLDDIAETLPQTLRAGKMQRRAATAGFDWSSTDPVFDKVEEELAEVKSAVTTRAGSDHTEAEMGDLLFACINLCRHLGFNPELALRRANSKFENRFRYIEDSLKTEGRPLSEASLDEMEALWQKAKDRE